MAITFLTNEDKTKLEDSIKEMESKGFDGIYDIVSDMPINDDINMMSWWTKFELLTTPGVYKINLKKPDIDSSGNYISNRYIEEALILLVSYDYIPQEGDVSDEKHLTQTLISSTNIYKREGVDYIDAGSTGWGDWSQVLTNDILTITEKQNKTDDTLTTTDKTIVGAINELEMQIGDINTALDNISEQHIITLEVSRLSGSRWDVNSSSHNEYYQVQNWLQQTDEYQVLLEVRFGDYGEQNSIVFRNHTFYYDSLIIFETVVDNCTYRAVLDSYNEWTFTSNELATEETVSNLETQIGDINNDILTITEKQNKTDDTLTTTDKTIVGAINELNSNKQAKDFVITGTVIGDLGTGDIDVSDVSCTYEEARAAFDGGRNVKCLFYVPEMGSYTEFRYKAHSDFMIMFECMWDDYNYLPVFMANDTWDWGYSTPYRGDYVETEAMYHIAPIKVRGTIDSNNTLTLNRAQHYGQIFENAEDIQDRIVSYLNQVPIIFYVFVEEQGRFMNCYVENIIGKRNSVGATAEVWSYDAISFSGHIGNTVYHLDCIKVRDDYTGSFAWQWSVYTAELVAKTEIETQIGDINTALENKTDKEFVVSIFEQLKALIEAGKTDEVIAVLDEAIFDLAVLA